MTQSNTILLKIVVLLLSALAIAGAGLFALDFWAARWIQSYLGFYLCLAVCIVFVVSASCECKKIPKTRWRDIGAHHSWGLGAALLGTYFLCLHEPFMLRVFNDEPGHLAVAKMMAINRGAFAPGSAFFEQGAYLVGDVDPIYRMYLFPFVLSIIHGVVGERIINAYFLNVFCLAGLLCFVYLIGVRIGRTRTAGLCAIALLMTSPLLQQVANSGAYDVLNALLLAVFIFACIRYFALKEAEAGMNLALTSALLLAYSRNEAVLYVLVFAGVFFLKACRTRSIKITWFAALSPIFLIGPFAARKIADTIGSQFSTVYDTQAKGFFDISYIIPNLREFSSWYFSFHQGSLNSILLNGLFVGCVILALGLLVPKLFNTVSRVREAGLGHYLKQRCNEIDPPTLVLASVGAIILVQFFLVMAHFWSPTDSSALRFYLPLKVFSALFVIMTLNKLTKRGLRISRYCFPVLVSFSLALFWVVTMPKGARAQETYRSLSAHYARSGLEWALENDDNRTLYITRMHDYFFLHKLPSMGLRQLSSGYDRIDGLVSMGIYDRVVIMTIMHYSPRLNRWTHPVPNIPIPDELELKPIQQRRDFLHGYMRIDELVGWNDRETGFVPLGEKAEHPTFDTDNELFEYIRKLRIRRVTLK